MDAPLGILMLDTRFPRIPGDVGNPLSYPFPIRKKTVPGATVAKVLSGDTADLLDQFVAAARELEQQGVVAITSSCGFLSPLQKTIADSVRVPVFLSSLLQVPLAHALTQGRIGILTANMANVTQVVLTSAGIMPPIRIAIAGLENSEAFRSAILSDGTHLDRDQIENDVLTLASELLARHPDLSAFVFECHNLPPYTQAVQAATHKPVFEIVSFARWIYRSIASDEFPSA